MARKFSLILGIGLLVAGIASAQASSSTSARTVHATIVDVSGNTVVARTDQGTKEYTVPDGFKFQMNGQDIGVADLKPGMKVTATITTTTTVTPVTVTEVSQAEVLAVAGGAIITRGANGNRKWTIEDVNSHDIRIFRDGKEVEISQLKVGDRLTATIVSHHPPTVVSSQSVKAAVSGAPAKPAPAPTAAPSMAAAAPAPAAEPAPAPAHHKLPKTASSVPLTGLAGVLSLAAGFALAISRRRTR
jgi:LPXTG-motif cell wall-anchored protein